MPHLKAHNEVATCSVAQRQPLAPHDVWSFWADGRHRDMTDATVKRWNVGSVSLQFETKV